MKYKFNFKSFLIIRLMIQLKRLANRLVIKQACSDAKLSSVLIKQ